MRFAIAAVLGLSAASALAAQTSSSIPDLGTAMPVTGNWTYAAAPDGSEAVFTNASGYPELWVHCARTTRRVSIARSAATAAPVIDVWTSSATRRLAAGFNPATRRLTGQVEGNDPLLDAMANSRGRLGFTIGSAPPLVVPAWPEVARVVEDCRA